jgi:hypothetical protein
VEQQLQMLRIKKSLLTSEGGQETERSGKSVTKSFVWRAPSAVRFEDSFH